MQKISSNIDAFVNGLSPEQARAFKAASVHDCFADAVRAEFGDEAAALVLSDVQAVFVLTDDAAQTKAGRMHPDVILHIYSDDSEVRSELDARQESLKMKMMVRGVHFDRMRGYQSAFDMKLRKPFEQVIEEIRGERNEAARPFDCASHLTNEEAEDILTVIEDEHLREQVRRTMAAYRQGE